MRQKNDEQHGNGKDDPHQHGFAGSTECQKEGIFDMSLYAVFELCLNRKDIADIGQQNGCYNACDNAEKDFQFSFYRERIHSVCIDDGCTEQSDDAEHKGLFEIAPESREELTESLHRFILCNFQCDGKECAGRRPDGQDRERAQQPQEIQNQQICHGVHEATERGFQFVFLLHFSLYTTDERLSYLSSGFVCSDRWLWDYPFTPPSATPAMMYLLSAK